MARAMVLRGAIAGAVSGLLAFVFALFGKQVLGKAFDNTIRAIEARNIPTTTNTIRTEV